MLRWVLLLFSHGALKYGSFGTPYMLWYTAYAHTDSYWPISFGIAKSSSSGASSVKNLNTCWMLQAHDIATHFGHSKNHVDCNRHLLDVPNTFHSPNTFFAFQTRVLHSNHMLGDLSKRWIQNHTCITVGCTMWSPCGLYEHIRCNI